MSKYNIEQKFPAIHHEHYSAELANFLLFNLYTMMVDISSILARASPPNRPMTDNRYRSYVTRSEFFVAS